MATSHSPRLLSAIVYAWFIALIGGGLYVVWNRYNNANSANEAAAPALSSADRRRLEVLFANVDLPADPALIRRFDAINAQHLGGTLPQTTVRWEPALADVGAMEQAGLTLQGLFGHAGTRGVILLNPELQADPSAVDRALCHEMVHAHLYATGDRSTHHGPAFQAVLKKLADAGAFEGVAADEHEKGSLREWLVAESTRLDDERMAIEKLKEEINEARAAIDNDIAVRNARGSSTAADGSDARTLESRMLAFNENLRALNDRLARDSADLDHFNQEVTRYNLMVAYPDGLDEERSLRLKDAAARSTRGG